MDFRNSIIRESITTLNTSKIMTPEAHAKEKKPPGGCAASGTGNFYEKNTLLGGKKVPAATRMAKENEYSPNLLL